MKGIGAFDWELLPLYPSRPVLGIPIQGRIRRPSTRGLALLSTRECLIASISLRCAC